MSAEAGFPGPIFVGGVGRSGTHPVGQLIAAGPRYHLIPTEARFHAVTGGLPDLLAGRTRLDRFLERLRGDWWRRGFGQRQGLQRVIGQAELDAAIADFTVAFDRDRWAAARALIHALLDPAAARAGKPSWVEVTGDSIEQAPTLIRLLPRARFVNMVRDGRAVTAARVRKANLPDSPAHALRKWEDMVRAADAAMRALPIGTVLVIDLDDLVVRDRDATYRRLVEFLEIDDDTRMRKRFERRISADRANVGRWRERLPPPEARRVDRRYRRVVRRLHRDGVAWAPKPQDGTLIARLRQGARRS